MRFARSRSRRVTPRLTKASFGRNGFLTGQQLYAQSPKNIMTKKHMVRLLATDGGSCLSQKTNIMWSLKLNLKKHQNYIPN